MNSYHSEPKFNNPCDAFTSTQRFFILAIVCLAGILSPLSSFMYTPALPALAQSIGVPISKINLTVTVYLVFGAISPFVWSSISEVYGRRLVYAVTLLVTMASSLGLCFTQSFAVVLALRALHAIGCSSARAIGSGVIRDVVPVQIRGGYMGFYSAGVGAGAAFGPVLGGILAQYSSWHGIFYCLAALSSFTFTCVILFFPETLRGRMNSESPRFLQPPIRILCPRNSHISPVASADEVPNRNKINLLGPFGILRYPDVLCILLVMGVCYLAWQDNIVAATSIYSTDYHLDEAKIGLTYLSNGVGGLLGNIVIGKVLDRAYEQQRLIESALGDTESEPHSRKNSVSTENSDPTPDRKLIFIEKARLRSLAYSIPAFALCIFAFAALIQAGTHIAFPIILSFWIGWWNSFILAPSATLMIDLFENSASIASATMNLVQGIFGAVGSATIALMIGKLNVWWSFFLLGCLCLLVLPLTFVQRAIGLRCRKKREDISN
ncbi:hypothetical protein GYMLUDRAFT_206388 [Collybiopsis luxurians FD-317 M1]|uniref:Major facilitator superfamily (MFS) profile domain-containing protein n=1 Tax=Collybiopsis luxurians FD-317 M1 TaxID=944289 RepID=A0A0D0CI73_9AGAR|nr:hypothetical protein GYMLUDRAFT_206388 [Collybiopsis luxurians FD-317 M1]